MPGGKALQRPDGWPERLFPSQKDFDVACLADKVFTLGLYQPVLAAHQDQSSLLYFIH